MSTTATLNPGDRMCRGRNGWFKPAWVWALWLGSSDTVSGDDRLDLCIYSAKQAAIAPIILSLSLGDALKLVEVIGTEIEKATGKEVSHE